VAHPGHRSVTPSNFGALYTRYTQDNVATCIAK